MKMRGDLFSDIHLRAVLAAHIAAHVTALLEMAEKPVPLLSPKVVADRAWMIAGELAERAALAETLIE